MTLWYGNLACDKIVSDPPETASAIVDKLRDQINDYNSASGGWAALGLPYSLMATSSGMDLRHWGHSVQMGSYRPYSPGDTGR